MGFGLRPQPNLRDGWMGQGRGGAVGAGRDGLGGGWGCLAKGA